MSCLYKKVIKKIGCLALTTTLVFLTSCKDDDAPNIEEESALENPTSPEAAFDERVAYPYTAAAVRCYDVAGVNCVEK